MSDSKVKIVKIVKRPRKSKVKINKIEGSSSKGGSCGLDHMQQRGSGPCGPCKNGCPCSCGCPYCGKMMSGGAMCAGERLHGCLRREIKKNNKRAVPQNGSNKDFTLHGKYPRFEQHKENIPRDIVLINKRSDVSVERLNDGRLFGGKKKMNKKKVKKTMKKSMNKKGGAKKGQYTAPSLKRVSEATPEYAKQHAELAKGGAKKKRNSKK